MTLVAAPVSPTSDAAAWLGALRSSGARRDQAVASLYTMLVRGARAEVARHRATLCAVPIDEIDRIATQAADEALVAVLAELDGFRGDSRFTTWASKFVLREARTRVRRKAWRHREVLFDSPGWMQRVVEGGPGDDVDAKQCELRRALAEAIGEVLTSHQRRVVVSLAVDGVPIDVLAERLSTTRGALYETLRDARRKLRFAIADKGVAVDVCG